MHDPRIGILAAKICREMAEADAFSPMAIEAISTELVIHMLRGCDVGDLPPRLADEAAEYMRGRAEGPLSIEAVAKAVGTDRFRLNRAFSKHKRCSPAEFLRLLRIEKALRLLQETRDPIVTIALRCGFTDQSHLTKSFQAVVGMSPAKFRKQGTAR
jgi:transcriptional regulator GlxA family with amidase domain